MSPFLWVVGLQHKDKASLSFFKAQNSKSLSQGLYKSPAYRPSMKMAIGDEQYNTDNKESGCGPKEYFFIR
jgi:hypothetical protein